MESIQKNIAEEKTSAEAENFIEEDGRINKSAIAKHNKESLIAALKSFGITYVVVTYSGGGDEGSINDISSTPAIEEAISSQVTYKDVSGDFDAQKRQWIQRVEDKTSTLESALEEFTYLLLELNGHEGYHNDEGGGGEVTIDAKSGSVVHDHYDYVVETVSSSHEF